MAPIGGVVLVLVSEGASEVEAGTEDVESTCLDSVVTEVGVTEEDEDGGVTEEDGDGGVTEEDGDGGVTEENEDVDVIMEEGDTVIVEISKVLLEGLESFWALTSKATKQQRRKKKNVFKSILSGFSDSTRVATMAATGMSGMTSLQCACNDVISNMASKTIDSSKRKQIRALEFYSGMGGMHYAMKRALDDEVAVVGAFDINTTVNSIYRHNFPHVSTRH